MGPAYSSVERTNIIYAVFNFCRTSPKVPPKKAQSGVFSAVDRVYMRQPSCGSSNTLHSMRMTSSKCDPAAPPIRLRIRTRTLNLTLSPNPRTHPNPNPIFYRNRNKVFGLEFTLAVPITILYNHRMSTCNNNICLLPMGTSNHFRITVLLTIWL